jgi:mannan endo-1,4-beta-mannosidase
MVFRKNLTREAIAFIELIIIVLAAIAFIGFDLSIERRFFSAKLESGVVYQFINKNSKKCLTVTEPIADDGTNVYQYSDVGTAAQSWKIEDVGDGYYKLIAQSSGKCLEVNNGSTDDGANIQQWTDTGADQQKWSFVNLGDGSYKIISRKSGKCLEVQDGSPDDQANVQQWSYVGVEHQKWLLVKINHSSKSFPKRR